MAVGAKFFPARATRHDVAPAQPHSNRRARYGLLQVKPQYLQCGGWRIPFSDVQEAVLFEIAPLPCYLLRVRTADHVFQFALARGRYWRRQRLFAVRVELARLRWPRPRGLMRAAAVLGSLCVALIALTR